MASNFVYDLVEPALLTNYVREFDNEVLKNQMGLEQFLPAQANPELEYRVTQNAFRDVDVAEYRAFDTQARMTGRQGFNRIRGELVPVSRQIPLGEEEMLRLRAVQGGSAANDSLINAIFSDAERMIRSVQMRLEVARGQVLTTGKFTLAENGVNVEADFGMSATHKPTAAASWATSGTDILSDLLAWTQLYVDDNGVEPGMILMGRKVLSYLYNNSAFLDAAAFAGTTPSRLNNDMVDAVLAANGLPPVMLYDTVARIDGAQTRIIPDDKVLLLPPAGEALGATHYGITAEAIKLASKGMIEESAMPGVVAVVLENDNPVQTFTLGTAVAVPVLPNPDLVICADVIP